MIHEGRPGAVRKSRGLAPEREGWAAGASSGSCRPGGAEPSKFADVSGGRGRDRWFQHAWPDYCLVTIVDREELELRGAFDREELGPESR